MPLTGNTRVTTNSEDTVEPVGRVEFRAVKLTEPALFIDEYEVLNELGRGTYGVVYRARDTQLKREVAIKVLHGGASAHEDELVRFRGEAEALGSLPHPNIVQVYNTGVHKGTPYIVMELVEGGSLLERMQGEPRDHKEAAQMVEVLARAIHAAHEKGIVHRDLKPGNILCTPDGTLKITDFGLAKRLDRSLGISLSGAAVGTPSYMAPEQADGKKSVGPATDVYALGAILYEMTTGRPPFRGPDILAVLDQVRAAEPVSPSRLVPNLPRDLSTICLKCLEKEPHRRYTSALALAEDLRRYVEDKGILARPATALERGWRFVRKHPLQTTLIALGTAVIVLLILLMRDKELHQRDKEFQQLQEANAELERAKQAEIQAFIQKEHDRSVNALDGILDLVREPGPLSHKPEIEPLYQELVNYYDGLLQNQQENDLTPRDKVADAMFKLGQLIRQRGKGESARKALCQAKNIYQGLDGDSPELADFRSKLAETLLEMGRVDADDLGEAEKARANYQKSRELLEQLLRAKPGETKYQRVLGSVLHWHGVLMSRGDASDRKEAREFYNRALKLRKEIVGMSSATDWDRAELARTFGYLGDLLIRDGDSTNADKAYWESHEIRKALYEESKNTPHHEEAKFQFARSLANFANLQKSSRMLDTAIDFYTQALEIQKELVRDNPARTDYQTDLGLTYNSIAELQLLRGRRDKALPAVEEAEKIYRKELKKDPERVDVILGLGTSLALHSRALIDESRAKVGPLLDEAELKLKEVLQRRRGEASYQLAAVYSLRGELASDPNRSAAFDAALAQLELASKERFRRLDLEDMRQDRAFKALREHAGQKCDELLAKLH